MYKLICKAYYCNWESQTYQTQEEADTIQRCPKCGARRITNLQLVEIGDILSED